MKNIPLSFLILMLLTCVIPVFSQDTNLSVSTEGGPSLNVLYGNKEAKKYFKPMPGGYAGILVQNNFTKIFSIRTGFTYERMGTDYKFNIMRLDSYSNPTIYSTETGEPMNSLTTSYNNSAVFLIGLSVNIGKGKEKEK